MDVVAAVRARLAGRIGETRYDLWFGPQTRLVPQGDTLVVEAPNRFYQDWLRRNFREALSSSYHDTIGCVPRLEFRIAENGNVSGSRVADNGVAGSRAADNSVADNSVADIAHAARVRDAHAGRATAAPHAQPVEQSETRRADAATLASPRHRPDASTFASSQRRFATLDALVPGECNQLALHSARMVLDQPGKISPLLFYGPTAIGKTHLLEGIYTEVRRRRGQAVYLSAEQFTNAFVEALRGGGLPSFRRKCRGVQWLLLDDVQFFCGKKATINELLHTIDTALREGRQLVLAADRPPQELPGLSDELVTRLQCGLSCAMQPPDLTVRLGILRSMARELELPLPESAAEFIAANLTAHARELSGALKLLKATCQVRGCELTLTLARETLADMIRVSSPAVGLAQIEQAVCTVFGLEPKRLQAADGSRGVNQPRMLAMWLARKYTRAALSEIGRYFGRRSHSTVISAQKRVDRWVVRGEALRVSDHEWPADEAIRRVEARLRVG
jgi:chromosomal replication initiator protein